MTNVDGKVTTVVLKRWMFACETDCRDQRDYLTQLDAAIGDADHGMNMERGFAAVAVAVAGLSDDATPGEVLRVAGETLVSKIGGASGALWGTALRRAGASLGDGPAPTGPVFATAVGEALAAIVELGAAEEGEKTMVDALAPAERALRSALAAGRSLSEGLDEARRAAEDGMRATVPLQAAKGRASYLGERSIGHQDPGATSTAIIVSALARTVNAD